MTLTIDDEVLESARLSAAQVQLELAVALFREDHLTLAQAAKLAKTDRLTFQHVLAARRIPLHYSVENLAEDLGSSQLVPES